MTKFPELSHLVVLTILILNCITYLNLFYVNLVLLRILFKLRPLLLLYQLYIFVLENAVWKSISHLLVSEKDRDYIGFATLPDQVHRKSVKKGFDFTLMVVGESGLGKSTLINSLFLEDLYKSRKVPDVCEKIQKTTSIEKKTIDIEERGVKLRWVDKIIFCQFSLFEYPIRIYNTWMFFSLIIQCSKYYFLSIAVSKFAVCILFYFNFYLKLFYLNCSINMWSTFFFY